LQADLAVLAFELTGTEINQTEDENSVAVVQLVSVIAADPDKNKDSLEALNARLIADASRDALDLYVASLRNDHAVSVNDRVIRNRILGIAPVSAN
jgi:hypothetical protein